MANFNIRLAKIDDAQSLANIQVNSYRTAYAPFFSPAYLEQFSVEEQTNDWRELLSAPEPEPLLVAETGGEVVGYALGRAAATSIPPYDGEVRALHVRRDYQMQGAGRALMLAMGERLKALGAHSLLVWVIEGNPARLLYERMGGRPFAAPAGRQRLRFGDDDEATIEEVAYGWPSLAAFARGDTQPGLNPPLRGIIFDVDGVLTFRGKVLEGAPETLNELRRRGLNLRFVTNSTLKSRASAAEKLRSQGFGVEDEEVFTASMLTAAYLRHLAPRSIWLLVEGAGQAAFGEFVHDEDNPETIVIGDNRSRFDFDTFNRAARLLMRGAKLIGMTSEPLDTSMGELELNVGAWVHLLENATGVKAQYVGKPQRFAFDMALQSLGLHYTQALMVGDRLSTDITGAKALGMRAALIAGGEFEPQHLSLPARPDMVLRSVAELPDYI